MNQSFLALVSRLVLATATLAIYSTAVKAASSVSTSTPQENPQLLAQQRQQQRQPQRQQPVQPQRQQQRQPQRQQQRQPQRQQQRQPQRSQPIQPQRQQQRQPQRNPRETQQNQTLVPQAVANAVLENLSQQTGIRVANLRVLEAQQQTWSDGCLGIGSPGITCAQTLVPGWRVVIGNNQQRWVYRTNLSGSVVKLDPTPSQPVATRPTPPAATPPSPPPAPSRLPQPPARRSSTGSNASTPAANRGFPDLALSQSPPTNNQPDGPPLIEEPQIVVYPNTARREEPQAVTPPPAPQRQEPQAVTPPPAPQRQEPQVVTPPPAPRREEPQAVTPPPAPRREAPEVITPPPAPQRQEPQVVTPPPAPRRQEPEIVTPPPAPRQAEPQVVTTPITPRPQPQLNRLPNRNAEEGVFTLAIRQPNANLTNVIARISLKAKIDNGYGKEQLIGDYRYRVDQRARFTGGMKAGDRIVVRLFDPDENSLIGFSEFELLPDNAAVNLILSNRPSLHRMVRTIYGIDADVDGKVDTGRNSYDYYTQVVGTQAGQQRVLFLQGMAESGLTWFEVAGLPVPPRMSVYPRSYNLGGTNEVMVVNAFGGDLTQAIATAPSRNSRITTIANNSTYRVSASPNTTAAPAAAPTAPPTPAPNTTAFRGATTLPPQPATPAVEVSFADVPQNHWAKSYIAQLVTRKILEGFPDGLYQPNAPVTRAELASILRKAFNRNKIRNVIAFQDVPTNHWAYPAIREAYEMGFLDTNTNRVFNPNQQVSRLDVLVALGRGLRYPTNGSTNTILRVYRDASAIPNSDRDLIAALTERDMVVSYPNVRYLYPARTATRAEVAALIYRALVSTGQAEDIVSPYVVVVASPTSYLNIQEQPRPQQTPATRPRSSSARANSRR
ncbi:MAG TPA: S-layer homology domain-containing protein [Leptolyngbyaceae cyanobacterium]